MMIQLAVLSLSLAAPAQADSPTPPPPPTDSMQRVESLYAQGAALYHARKYRAALSKFEEAYTLFPEPNLLYNMGRAHEALGEIDRSIQRYKQCIADPQTLPEVAAKAL